VNRIQTTNCSASHASVLMRNSWKYTRVASVHVRIHPPDSYVQIPGPSVEYTATIEILSNADQTWGVADDECAAIVSALFPTLT
jgi:hypothetical protein